MVESMFELVSCGLCVCACVPTHTYMWLFDLALEELWVCFVVCVLECVCIGLKKHLVHHVFCNELY